MYFHALLFQRRITCFFSTSSDTRVKKYLDVVNDVNDRETVGRPDDTPGSSRGESTLSEDDVDADSLYVSQKLFLC